MYVTFSLESLNERDLLGDVLVQWRISLMLKWLFAPGAADHSRLFLLAKQLTDLWYRRLL
jgi:hypothetical protein